MSLNKCLFIGNLGRDAELRYTGGGTAIASFSIACNDVWTDKDGQKQERVEWVRVSLWGKPAEAVAQYLTKGKQVYVEGKLQSRKYQAKDGTEKTAVEIRADRVQLLGGRPEGGPQRPRPRRDDPEYAQDPRVDGGGFEDDEETAPF